MAQSSWEADKMLDVYIYDYLMKRNLHATAKAFMTEGKVSLDPVAIDAPGGFLFEWWSVFWDIFIARTNDKHSEVAASYIETQQMKAREQVQQQQQQHQLHMQQLQLLQQRQAQQQHRRDANHSSLNGSSNAETLMVPSIANVMAAKMYEDQLKHPHQRDGLDEAASNPGQPSGSLLLGTAGNVTAPAQKVQVHSQQMPINAQIKNEVGVVLNQRSPTADPSLFGVPGGTVHPKSNLLNSGINQGLDASPLKGWPLTGIDQLRSNLVQQGQNSFLQSPQQLQQFQLLTVQQQQRYLIQAQAQAQARAQAQAQAQAQANLTSSGSSVLGDMDHRRFRVLVRSGLTGMDGQPTGSDGSQALASPMQVTSPTGRASLQDQMDLLIKVKMAQRQHQQSQTESQQQQLSPHNQHHQQEQQQPQQQKLQLVGIPQNQQQDRMDGVDSIPKGSNLSNSFQANEQIAVNVQNGRKRKQLSSSGPGNSSETGNTAGPPNSAPSTPSIHTPADVMSMAGTLQQSSSIPKNLMMYGSDETGGLASPSTQLADIGRFGEHGSLDDNVESFLSHDDGDPRDGLFGITKPNTAGHNMDVSKGFSFGEVGCLRASNSKVVCCHFSSDGKLLASAGHDKKAVLWNMDTLKLKSTFQEHLALITDVRFSPISTRLATSSFDKTVRVWDADSPSYSLRTFTGHSTSVMSLDFHTNSTDLLCSCDGNGEIRYWNVSKGVCTRVSKGGMTQMRFQPRVGKLLAAAGENLVSVFDVETDDCLHSLKRHTKPVHSLCWDANGDLIASVSEDSVRVWSLASGGECIHELISNGNKFHSCVFHPNYPSLLIIGCYESLELWNMRENKRVPVKAHDGLIAALAQSPATGMVASASHDKCVKLWK